MSRRIATFATLTTLAWLLAVAPAQSAEQQYSCNSVLSANSSQVQLLAGLLGLVLQPVGYVGVSCTPIAPSAPTNGQLYCGGTSFGGLIVTGGRPGRCAGAATTKARGARKATAKRRAARA